MANIAVNIYDCTINMFIDVLICASERNEVKANWYRIIVLCTFSVALDSVVNFLRVLNKL